MPALLIFSYLLWGYIDPTSQAFGKVYYKVKAKDKVIALTFDDGPNEPCTSEVLNILDANSIRGTFFVVGKNVELYPDITRRIYNESHIVGNHTYKHNANHALSPDGGREIRMAQESIYRVIGVKPHLYRPPHGKRTPWELEYIREEKMIEVTWSVSANDQEVKSAEDYAREITDKARPGGIILLHDGYGTLHDCPQADKSLTVKALPIIIENLNKQGYVFVTVSELFDVLAYIEELP